MKNEIPQNVVIAVIVILVIVVGGFFYMSSRGSGQNPATAGLRKPGDPIVHPSMGGGGGKGG
jgi:hypothetical protein